MIEDIRIDMIKLKKKIKRISRDSDKLDRKEFVYIGNCLKFFSAFLRREYRTYYEENKE